MYDRDIKDFAHAEKLAAEATAANGKTFLPIDRGGNVWPRYAIEAAPVVGEPVSMAFNGDSYPCGKIVKVSASFRRVATDTGDVFFRRRLTASWVHNGGTFALIHGHHNERNPSF